MKDLVFDAVAMATVEDAGKKSWVVYAKNGKETFKIIINVGEYQMQTIEREIPAEMPCA